MAATVKRNIWFHSSDDGVAPIVERGLMAASQGILIPNSPVYLCTAGTWKAALTSDGTNDVVHGLFVGLDDPTATWPIAAALAGTETILVQRISAGDKYCVYCENNDSDAAVAQASVGNEYGIRIATGASKVGYTTMDINNSNDTVKVVDIMSNLDSIGYTTSDDPGVALVRFVSAVLDVELA